jgi:hypothetical protein
MRWRNAALTLVRVAVLGLVAAFVVGGVQACGSSTGGGGAATRMAEPAGSIKIASDRFPHGLHTGSRPEIRNWRGRGLACADCHDSKAVREGRVARPGLDQHSPCDDCHKAEFAKPPGLLCKVCHSAVDPRATGASPLQPYPERGAIQTLASTFSHRSHLDAASMEAATGSHVSCSDCHERNAETRDPMVPGHKACARCHEQNASAKGKLAMEHCAGCHPDRSVDLKRGRLFITGDLKFHHATHETDRAGQPVACATCHASVEQSTSRDAMAVPAMERCATCHEDAKRSPDRVRMDNCAVCHGQIEAGTPPTSHMVSGTRPTDHTIEFRKHHSDAASARDAKCRFCHKEVAGAHEDSCFQCHQVMKPRDHNLMFRDDHGREAQVDGSRCAACHTPETCVACHSVPPRSHTPIADFRQGGHAEQARFGLTSCLTCHTYQDTCSKCHRGTR